MENAIVAIDFSKIDNTLIKYAKELVHEKLGIDKIYFMNFIEDLTSPKKEVHELMTLLEPERHLDEKIKSNIEYRLKNNNAKDLNYEIEVHEGKPYKKLIHWAEIKKTNLVVLGVKDKSQHSGITSKRVLHALEKNILLIPEMSTASFRNILVPIDYSENSKRAFQQAMKIASDDPLSTITLLNVVNGVPPGGVLGTHYTEYANLFIENSKQAMKNFIKDIEVDTDKIKTDIITGAEYSISNSIHQYAGLKNFDFIVLGAQSHSRFRNFLVGSVAESLVVLNLKVPVLIIR